MESSISTMDDKSTKRYEQFPHTADIGVRVFGSNMKELFENAAYAMFDVVADLDGIKTSSKKIVEATASDYETLLVAFLDELLYCFYTKSLIFSKFNILELNESYVKAEAGGRPVGANRNRLKTEIKAVTYNDLKIKKISDGYQIEIIFDV